VFAPGPGDALRFAARVVADPAHTVGLWRSLTGCKAVGCVPPIPVPEILHAAGLLPISLAVQEIPRALRSRLDAWVVAPDGMSAQKPVEGKGRFEFPTVPPADLAAALDLLESLAEWAGVLSGRPVTEGGLWKSVRAYRERNDLLILFEAHGGKVDGLPSGVTAGDIARAGDFLPPEAHSLLLAQSLRMPSSATPASWREESEDPLLRLARRMIERRGVETPLSSQQTGTSRNTK
jgi:hypothetical protein